jgi:hypothetical protein
MNERRKVARHHIEEDVFGKVKATVPARIVDISPFGAQVEVPSALRPSVECDIWLPIERGQVRVRARVLRCRAAAMRPDGDDGANLLYRAGLEFVGLSEKDVEALQRAYPAPEDAPVVAVKEGRPVEPTRRRTGPVKIRLSSEDIRKRVEDIEREG